MPHNLRWLDGLVLAHPAHSAEELRITIDWCVEGGHPVLTLSRQQDAARLILCDVDIGFLPLLAEGRSHIVLCAGGDWPLRAHVHEVVERGVPLRRPAPGELCLG